MLVILSYVWGQFGMQQYVTVIYWLHSGFTHKSLVRCHSSFLSQRPSGHTSISVISTTPVLDPRSGQGAATGTVLPDLSWTMEKRMRLEAWTF